MESIILVKFKILLTDASPFCVCVGPCGVFVCVCMFGENTDRLVGWNYCYCTLFMSMYKCMYTYVYIGLNSFLLQTILQTLSLFPNPCCLLLYNNIVHSSEWHSRGSWSPALDPELPHRWPPTRLISITHILHPKHRIQEWLVCSVAVYRSAHWCWKYLYWLPRPWSRGLIRRESVL